MDFNNCVRCRRYSTSVLSSPLLMVDRLIQGLQNKTQLPLLCRWCHLTLWFHFFFFILVHFKPWNITACSAKNITAIVQLWILLLNIYMFRYEYHCYSIKPFTLPFYTVNIGICCKYSGQHVHSCWNTNHNRRLYFGNSSKGGYFIFYWPILKENKHLS